MYVRRLRHCLLRLIKFMKMTSAGLYKYRGEMQNEPLLHVRLTLVLTQSQPPSMSFSCTETFEKQMRMPGSEVVVIESVGLATENKEEDSFVLPAQRNNKPLAEPVVVISPKFLAPYPVDLTIVKKMLKFSDGNFVVQDVNGEVIFKVEGKLFTVHNRRIVQDAVGNPIVSLKRKVFSFFPSFSPIFDVFSVSV